MGWQVTATVVVCPASEGEQAAKGIWPWRKKAESKEARVVVFPDGRVECTLMNRYGQLPGCPGVPCPPMAEYRDKMLAEEAEAAKQASG